MDRARCGPVDRDPMDRDFPVSCTTVYEWITVLHEPGRHVALTNAQWDEAVVRAAIDRIATDTFDAFEGERLWPVHPLDRSPERPADCLKPLFNGAGGVLWALRRLRSQGAQVAAMEDSGLIDSLPMRQRVDDIALGRPPDPAFAIGETGLRLLAWADRRERANAAADRAGIDLSADALEDAIDRTAARTELGFALGAAGGLLAAVFAFERSGEARWARSFSRIANALWSRWIDEPAFGGHHWLQTIYGHTARQMGALHGLGGITFALARGVACFGPSAFGNATSDVLGGTPRELTRRTRHVLLATARREGAFANWPLAVGDTTHPEPDVLWLQHCIGAPGMISCAAWVPAGQDTAFDELLLGAGELVWLAGPTDKLPSICHGAPGSGYAFLKLFERTGDSLWLERARRFGMHGIEHAQRAVREHGQRKFSLWTGDLGLALFLQDCLAARARIPLLDVF